MKGNNTLHLNLGTMIDALDQYFVRQFAPGMAPVVTNIKAVQDGNSPSFLVSVKEQPPADDGG